MVENGCMTTYEDDGDCLATDDMALQEVTDLEMVKGDWWVLKGTFLRMMDKLSGHVDYLYIEKWMTSTKFD